MDAGLRQRYMQVMGIPVWMPKDTYGSAEESPLPNLPPQGGKEQEVLSSPILLPSPLEGRPDEGLGAGLGVRGSCSHLS